MKINPKNVHGCPRLITKRQAIIDAVKKTISWCWHPVLGALVPVFGMLSVAWGVLWFVGFIVYEIAEAKEVKDQPCWDIRDFLIGFGIALFVALIFSFCGVIL